MLKTNILLNWELCNKNFPNWQIFVFRVNLLVKSADRRKEPQMTFYEAVIIAMKQQGIKSIAELCRRADDEPNPLLQSYFSKLKSGHTTTVTWDKALQIARALGITPNDLYEIQMSDRK